jgi:hypothetical protein
VTHSAFADFGQGGQMRRLALESGADLNHPIA